MIRSINDRTLESYFKQKISTNEQNTQEGIKYSLKNFESFCHEREKDTLEGIVNKLLELQPDPREEIISEVLQDWVTWSHKRNHSPGTIRRYFSAVTRYLNYRGIRITEDIRDGINFPHKIKEQRFPLRIEHIQEIFRVASFRKIALYLALLSSGMRIGEAVSIKKQNLEKVYSASGEMRIKINIPAKFTKTKTSRSVFISKEAWNYIYNAYERLNDDDFVWSKNRNNRTTVFAEGAAIRRYLEKIGLDHNYESTHRKKISLHSFRAYFFTKAARVDVDFAQSMLGHTGYLNREYDRLTDDEKLEIYLKIEPELIISEEDRLKIKNQKLEIEKLDLEKRIPFLVNEAVERVRLDLINTGWKIKPLINSKF